MMLSLLAAVAENGVIGRDGALPWRLPADLARFKALTIGKPILMGRKTFESIGHALPARRNLVLTRRPRAALAEVEVVATLDEALQRCAGASELCVIGGAALYAATLPMASRIYLTRVHATVAGDTYFPPIDASAWLESSREYHAADPRHQYAMSFIVLERAAPTQH